MSDRATKLLYEAINSLDSVGVTIAIRSGADVTVMRDDFSEPIDMTLLVAADWVGAHAEEREQVTEAGWDLFERVYEICGLLIDAGADPRSIIECMRSGRPMSPELADYMESAWEAKVLREAGGSGKNNKKRRV